MLRPSRVSRWSTKVKIHEFEEFGTPNDLVDHEVVEDGMDKDDSSDRGDSGEGDSGERGDSGEGEDLGERLDSGERVDSGEKRDWYKRGD